MADETTEERETTRVNLSTNSQGWFQAVSPQFLELVGRPVEALAGVNLVDLVHPLDTVAARDLLSASAWGAQGKTVSIRLFGAGDLWVRCEATVPAVDGDRLTIDLVPIQLDPVGDGNAASAVPPEHVTDFAPIPGVDVASERAAVRASAGDTTTPMLEIDADGRTTFVSGPWSALSSDGAQGADVFEELLAKSGRADQILAAMTAVSETSRPSQHPIAVGGLPPKLIRTVPIPSPHRAGVVHTLIAVVPESQSNAPEALLIEPSGVTERAADAAEVGAASTSGLAGFLSGDVEAQAVTPAVVPDEVAVVDPTDDDDRAQPLDGESATSRRWPTIALWVLAAVVAFFVLRSLFGGDESQVAAPITTELEPTEAVEVKVGQMWRPVGANVLGELHGVTVTNEGAVVADVDGRVIWLDAQGAAVSASSIRAVDITAVSDVAADTAGNVWVLDAGPGHIFRLTTNGEAIQMETGADPLRNARGLGIGADDTLWVASTAASQLTRYNSDGALVGTISLPGRQPSDVVELDDGTLWVVDAEVLELIHISATGDLLAALPLESFSSVEGPHLAVVGEVMWVTEPTMSAIFAIDLTTEQPTGARVELLRPDAGRVERPVGIAADASGRIWVVDSLGGAIVMLDS